MAQEPPDAPVDDTTMTNGEVYAAVKTGNTIYLGRYFTYADPYTGSAVPVDASTGNRLSTFPKVNGEVLAIASDGSSGWYIGGNFTEVGETARNNIAHVLSNGSVDASWDPNANNTVNTIVVSGSTVYVGGDFTSIGGQSRNYVASLSASTGNATSWNPTVNNQIKNFAVASTSSVFLAGSFTRVSDRPRPGFAQFGTYSFSPPPEQEGVTITATIDPYFTFQISSDTCALGTLTTDSVNTCQYTLAVGTNANNGAVITIQAISDGTNAYLNRDGAPDTYINDITENTLVTAGSEGYGIAVTAGSGWTEEGDFNDDDTPIPSSVTNILSTSGPILSSVSSTITHKAAISTTTESGTYSQTVQYIATGTF